MTLNYLGGFCNEDKKQLPCQRLLCFSKVQFYHEERKPQLLPCIITQVLLQNLSLEKYFYWRHIILRNTWFLLKTACFLANFCRRFSFYIGQYQKVYSLFV